MNALVPAKLPAHLAHLASNPLLAKVNAFAASGVSLGGWPRISIRASRFRLQNPVGEEIVIQESFLDVIVVDANPHGLSKSFYKGAYDPTVEEVAPTCYSDNGVGPSSRAAEPQAPTCAACPHNVWGSKINPSGSKTKACTDSKKLAVFIAGNTDGPVYELRIPAASLKAWGAFIAALDKHGIPASTIVTRISFDTSADFPKLSFAPAFTAQGQVPFIDENQAAAVSEMLGTDEVDLCTGRNDKPINGDGAIPGPKNAVMRIGVDSAAAPASAPLPAASYEVAAEKPRRTRRSKAEMEAARAANFLPPQTKFSDAAPAHGAVLQPQGVTNAALDDLIAQAMKI